MAIKTVSLREFIELLAGPERARDATSRLYNDPGGPNAQNYTCKDGKCIMAVAVQTESGLPGDTDVMLAMEMPNPDNIDGISDDEYDRLDTIYQDIRGEVEQIIELNDRGGFVNEESREISLGDTIHIYSETYDYLRQRGAEKGWWQA